MFNTYEELKNFLERFSSGQQVSYLLETIINSDLKGFIIRDTDLDENPATLEFIIVTTNLLIEATLVIDNRTTTNNNFVVKTRKLSDISTKDVNLSNHGEVHNPVYKTRSYTFSFSDGYVLNLSNSVRYFGSFDVVVQHILLS